MLQAKFQDHKTSVSGEDFKGFHHILDFFKIDHFLVRKFQNNCLGFLT